MANELSMMLTLPPDLNPGGVQVRMAGTTEGAEFCLADICQMLDLGSPHKVAERLDDDEKVRKIVPTPGGLQEMWFVTEPGLHRILMTTRLKTDTDNPEVAARNARILGVRRLIFHEVMPSIHRHGCFPPPKTIQQDTSPTSALAILRQQCAVLLGVCDRQIALEATQAAQQQQLDAVACEVQAMRQESEEARSRVYQLPPPEMDMPLRELTLRDTIGDLVDEAVYESRHSAKPLDQGSLWRKIYAHVDRATRTRVRSRTAHKKYSSTIAKYEAAGCIDELYAVALKVLGRERDVILHGPGSERA